MDTLKDRVDSLRKQEASVGFARNTIYDASFEQPARSTSLTSSQDLIEQIKTLQSDLEEAQNAGKHYYNLMNQATQENRDLQKALDRDRFIVALIDGDSMPFLDSFVVRGTAGGIEAGRQFREALSKYHQTNPFHRGNDKILIYIAANLHGLSHAYTSAGITADESVVRAFFGGISQSHPLTDFVDAGHQKEAADSKLRAQMEIYYSNTHCQQVIFGGSDSGYAPFLDAFAKAKDVNKRIAVLSPKHMPPAMCRTLSQFAMTAFPEIFREAKFAIRGSVPNTPSGNKRPASDVVSPLDRKPPPPVYHGPEGGSTKPSAIESTNNAVNDNEYHPENPFLVERPRPQKFYYVNDYGQRLDLPLVYDQQYLRYLYQKKARLCNNYYLRGWCAYGDTCSWDHSESLTSLQLDTLRHKARTSACRDPFCADAECKLGHLCPRTTGECTVEACKFLPQQHNVSCARVFEVNPVTGEHRQCSAEPFWRRSKGENERSRRPSATFANTESYNAPSLSISSGFLKPEGMTQSHQGESASSESNTMVQHGSAPDTAHSYLKTKPTKPNMSLDELIATYRHSVPSRSGSTNPPGEHLPGQNRP